MNSDGAASSKQFSPCGRTPARFRTTERQRVLAATIGTPRTIKGGGYSASRRMTCTKRRSGGMYLINALEQRLCRIHTGDRTESGESGAVTYGLMCTRPHARVCGKLSNSRRVSCWWPLRIRSPLREERTLAISGTTRVREKDVLTRILERNERPKSGRISPLPHTSRKHLSSARSLALSHTLSLSRLYVVHRRRNRELTREGRRCSRDYNCRRNLVDWAR